MDIGFGGSLRRLVKKTLVASTGNFVFRLAIFVVTPHYMEFHPGGQELAWRGTHTMAPQCDCQQSLVDDVGGVGFTPEASGAV